MFRLFALLIGYGFGAIQIAYIVGRLRGIDIREYGSGNSGATNALRVMGTKTGLIVFFADIAKCIIAVWVVAQIFGDSYWTISTIYTGLGVVLGHCFPFYLKFKGGKGVACTVGLILSINIMMASTIFAVGLAVFIFTRYVSLSSIIVSVLTPIFLYLYSFSAEVIIIASLIGAVCIYMHKDNIERLIKGTERQLK